MGTWRLGRDALWPALICENDQSQFAPFVHHLGDGTTTHDAVVDGGEGDGVECLERCFLNKLDGRVADERFAGEGIVSEKRLLALPIAFDVTAPHG